MDKEKQITEMAKEMCKVCKSIEETCYMKKQPCSLIKEEAKTLYEHGYRKIPKDARVFIPTDDKYVLLSREEYSDYLILQKNHEFIREKAKELQADNERLYKNIGKFKEIASKETAEKIYRMADEICTGSQNDGDKILAMIKDTFGVEIKEN